MSAQEQAGAREIRDSGEEYQPGSLSIYDFTPADLRANQRGYLTDSQRGWLQSTARGIVGSIWLARRQASKVAGAQLQRVQGKVRLDQDYSLRSGINPYKVIVGSHKFSFPDDMSSIFHEGRDYSIYFCQSGPYQLIMSCEALGS